MTLVENLRKYVGEQVPPEVHSQTWELERQKFLENMQVSVQECICVGTWGSGWGASVALGGACRAQPSGEKVVPEAAWRPYRGAASLRPQHLQEDRDGLHATVELLQVRVQSLTHILALQEEELTRKVWPDPQIPHPRPHPTPTVPHPPPCGWEGSMCPRTCLDLFLPVNSSCCSSCCPGKTEEKQRCHLLPLLPQEPTLSSRSFSLRFNLQIRWSLSLPGSASPC